MADPVLNTYTTKTAVGERESLAAIIARTDPVDTPCYSNFIKTRARARKHQWQEWDIAKEVAFIDAADVGVWALLAAYAVDDVILHNDVYYTCIQIIASSVATEEPGVGATWEDFWTTANPLPPYRKEGEDLYGPGAPVQAITPSTLLQNITSIFSEGFIVSGSLQAVDVAGRRNELAWQRITQALEVRRSVERAILRNQVYTADPEPYLMAGLPTWADGGDGTSLSTVTPAYDQAAVELAMQTQYQLGVTCDTLVMTPANKKTFSESTTATPTAKTNEYNVLDRQAVKWGAGSVSVYLTDLGLIQTVVDRYISPDVDGVTPAFLFDSTHIRVAEIAERIFAEQILGQTGDAHKRMIIWSGTLEVTSPLSVTIPV